MRAGIFNSRSGTSQASVGALVLVAAWVAACALVDPRADVPLIDDWIYAVSVERILAGKGFTVLDWSSTFPAVQIWWGTLFAAIGGFSYTALRVSTLVLAIVGALGFLALLRALGCRPADALLGAATLLFYPVGFVLSFTFMTDVPFVAVTLVSLWALVIGLRDARTGPVVLGLLAALAAFLIRPVAIALPAALLIAVCLHGSPPFRGRAGVLAVATLVVMGVAAVIGGRLWKPVGGEGGLVHRIEQLRYIFLVSPLVYAEAFFSMLAHLGLAVLPALAATAPPLRRWPWRMAVLLLAAVGALALLAPAGVSALRSGRATWSTEELGAARPLLLGSIPRSAVRAGASVAATAVGLVAAACILDRIARGVRRGGVLRSSAWSCVAAFGLVSMAICFVLWFFYDRYYLPLVPVALALVLGVAARDDGRAPGTGTTGASKSERGAGPRSQTPKLRLRPAALLLVALAILDVTGTRDMLAYARAVAAAATRLAAAGIPAHRLDAGYAENGWRLYAHPENLPAGARVERDVSRITSDARQPFVIANAPLPGYRIRESVVIPTWWAAGDRIYVLEE